ncbi:DUF4215 domain-containing protein [Polyangium sp. 15x6]|uniref:DUF4215 domain-containing protein n=1 Tax=Polyangium sp. 15x6 TaxID=3042687 RepID=UPI00249BD958|nr:DUF4215 domain-containing protein [Polyangium sp. 15x6]MDI3281758.1 DUF4215 domain-containing protein [Polyangium sp. 15x6]
MRSPLGKRWIFDKRVLSALVFSTAVAVTSTASAQIVSSAADNDMHPTFTGDGWVNVVGTYDPIATGANFLNHMWLSPPDGNSYGGGVQYDGVPGVRETIQKTIAGLTAGQAYAVEWYIMADRVLGSSTEEAWFDVTFCGSTQETLHIPWAQNRKWIQEVKVFTANAIACTLSFAARNPTGNNSNWIFLDSVQVAVATNTDFAIAATGPLGALPGGNSAPVNVTVTNNGPSLGTAPVVTYPLPAGVSVLGGAAGSLSVSGADGASWGCVANAAPQTITCTRAAALAVGTSSAFSFSIDLAASAVGTIRTSTLTVKPTFQAGNFDPVAANNTATFLTTTLAPVCGNGVVEIGEGCDDGNTTAGDGCSSTCQVQPGYTCPTPNAPCVEIDECALGTDNCSDDATCTNTPGSFTCTCNMGYTGNGVVCVDIDECLLDTDDCDDDATCTNTPGSFTCACNMGYTGDGVVCTDIDECALDTDNCDANATCMNNPGSFTCACNMGYAGDGVVCAEIDECALNVDNCDANATCTNNPGSFTCACNMGYAGNGVVCVTVCGDGIIAGSEVCDDGNTTNDDGCSNVCEVEPGWSCNEAPSVCGAAACGDGIVAGDETCDDANTNANDGCSPTCVMEPGWTCGGEPSICEAGACGDGILAGVEGCDDGNTTNDDGCDDTCTVEDGWSCEGAPSTCEAAACGDGFVAGDEQCDDGGTVAGDGCDAACAVEPGWSCNGEPSTCEVSACGDGVIAGAEACDDGNTASGDGCSDVCAVEPGYTCTGAPSACVTSCGDGVIAGAEACDDGNDASGDGCSGACAVEPGYTCTGAPSECVTTCGDGVIAGAEACDDGNTAGEDGCDAACAVEPGFTCEDEPSACDPICDASETFDPTSGECRSNDGEVVFGGACNVGSSRGEGRAPAFGLGLLALLLLRRRESRKNKH